MGAGVEINLGMVVGELVTFEKTYAVTDGWETLAHNFHFLKSHCYTSCFCRHITNISALCSPKFYKRAFDS